MNVPALLASHNRELYYIKHRPTHRASETLGSDACDTCISPLLRVRPISRSLVGADGTSWDSASRADAGFKAAAQVRDRVGQAEHGSCGRTGATGRPRLHRDADSPVLHRRRILLRHAI